MIELPDGRVVRITVEEIHRDGKRVRLGFSAPMSVAIWRTEIAPARGEEGQK